MSSQQTQTESSVPAIIRFTMGLPKPTRHLESRHPCTVHQTPKYIVTIHVTVYSTAVTQDRRFSLCFCACYSLNSTQKSQCKYYTVQKIMQLNFTNHSALWWPSSAKSKTCFTDIHWLSSPIHYIFYHNLFSLHLIYSRWMQLVALTSHTFISNPPWPHSAGIHHIGKIESNWKVSRGESGVELRNWKRDIVQCYVSWPNDLHPAWPQRETK